ncbi:MAG: ATP phosphoribosyltransferase, partial [Rhodococcus sp.]|nr:ATP phosphoribosyltransferase [Rhodococcus sp. (in: high G+C Gram-positive bacteria)]
LSDGINTGTRGLQPIHAAIALSALLALLALMRMIRAYNHDLAARGLEASVIRLDGAVEISIQLGVADAIADVVGSGRTLRQHDLVPFGDVLCDSEGVLIEQAGAPEDPARNQLVERIRGIVFAQQNIMLDYDCPRSILADAIKVTPGIESPTLSPLADDNWVAVRAMVPIKGHNDVMDALAQLGAKAILASNIRSCRAL